MTDFFRSKAFEKRRTRGSSYDQQGYTHFVVWRGLAGRGRPDQIESGWEFKEDAQDRLAEFKEEMYDETGFKARVITRNSLKRFNIDPSKAQMEKTTSFHYFYG